MKIGVITQLFPPEPAASIPSTLAQELAVRGHQVRVLTGFPNYPDGKIYPGFRQQWRHESRRNGVTVRRVPSYLSHDASALRRAANYLSFAATSALAGLRYLAGADVVYVHLTPPTVALAPLLAKLAYRTPVVIHVQDFWPESVTDSSMAPTGVAGRAVSSLLTNAMKIVYRQATGIAAIAPSMKELLADRGAEPSKVEVVLNWTDETLFRPQPRTAESCAEVGYRGRCTIMYAGTMGPFQNIRDSIRAAASVQDSGTVDLVFVGTGIEAGVGKELAATLGARNVRFLGQRDPTRMAGLYAAADFQLVTLKDLPVFRGIIPSKLQAALACGSPVITAVPGDCAALVETESVGLSCAPEDWQGLADCFIKAANMSEGEQSLMASRARNLYESKMSMTAGVDILEDMLASAARSGRRR